MNSILAVLQPVVMAFASWNPLTWIVFGIYMLSVVIGIAQELAVEKDFPKHRFISDAELDAAVRKIVERKTIV